MKTLLITVAVLCLFGGTAIFLARRAPQHPAGVVIAPTSATTDGAAESLSLSAAERPKAGSSRETRRTDAAETPHPATSSAGGTVNAPSLPFQQALGTLISGQSSFGQKQAAWHQIKESGHLDLLIGELEKQSAINSNAAEYPATLGQAYLQKAGTIKDLREQGILGMKADLSFEAALNLEPSNWDAGFWKAAAMSYWPPQLGKGPEVIERFVELMKLQETRTPQPEYAQTYVLLGEQYQKQGYSDYAREIWQRGAALFPNDPRLLEKSRQPQSQAEQAVAR